MGQSRQRERLKMEASDKQENLEVSVSTPFQGEERKNEIK